LFLVVASKTLTFQKVV